MRFEQALQAMREGERVKLRPNEPSEGNWRDNVHIKDDKMYMASDIYWYPVTAKLTYKDILSEKWEIDEDESQS